MKSIDWIVDVLDELKKYAEVEEKKELHERIINAQNAFFHERKSHENSREEISK